MRRRLVHDMCHRFRVNSGFCIVIDLELVCLMFKMSLSAYHIELAQGWKLIKDIFASNF